MCNIQEETERKIQGSAQQLHISSRLNYNITAFNGEKENTNVANSSKNENEMHLTFLILNFE